MLTQGDLQKIGQVVDEKLIPIKQEMKSMEGRLTKKIGALRGQIKKDLNMTIGHFDRGDLDLEKRVKKIEDRLPFPTSM